MQNMCRSRGGHKLSPISLAAGIAVTEIGVIVDGDDAVISAFPLPEGIMTETEPEYMPGHPATLVLEQADLEPDENPEPGEREG